MSRKEDALRFSCPDCKAKPNVQCTYMTDQWKNVGRWPYQRVLIARVGEPTKQPHNGRQQKLWKEERRAKLEAYYARASVDPLADVRRAQADFMRREHETLRIWLRRYAALLWS